jgi:hypothetical protein
MKFGTSWDHLNLLGDAIIACEAVIENSRKRAVDACRSIVRLDQLMLETANSSPPSSRRPVEPVAVSSADVLIFQKKRP